MFRQCPICESVDIVGGYCTHCKSPIDETAHQEFTLSHDKNNKIDKRTHG